MARDTERPSLFYTCEETPAGFLVLICSEKLQGSSEGLVPLTSFPTTQPRAGKRKPVRHFRMGFSSTSSVNQLLVLET